MSVNHAPWTHTLSATPQKTRTLRRRCCSRCCRTAKSCEKVTRKLRYQRSPSDYSHLRSLDGFRPGGAQRGRSQMRNGSCVFAWIKSRRRRFKLLQIFGDTLPMFAYYYHSYLRHSFLCALIYSTALFALLRATLWNSEINTERPIYFYLKLLGVKPPALQMMPRVPFECAKRFKYDQTVPWGSVTGSGPRRPQLSSFTQRCINDGLPTPVRGSHHTPAELRCKKCPMNV